jgi:hypothetical protein
MTSAPGMAERKAPVPAFEFVGRVEDITFGGGSDPSDSMCQWNPKRGS